MFSFLSTFIANSSFESFFMTRNTFPKDPLPMTLSILKLDLLISVEIPFFGLAAEADVE